MNLTRRQEGFSLLVVFLGVSVLIFVVAGAYFYYSGRLDPLLVSIAPDSFKSIVEENVLKRTVRRDDSIKKYTVNYVHSLMKNYYAQRGSYPKNLIELRNVFNLTDDGELKLYSNPPFYFSSDGTTYEYYAKLNSGEIFKGDQEAIKRDLDSVVELDVMQIVEFVNLYYSETQRLPNTIEEITMLPSRSFFKPRNNPFTGKPYTYIPKVDGTGFVASGTLSNGTEYKMDIPVR